MDVSLYTAPFWLRVQHDFIISHWKKKDDEWAMVVDILNEHLHTEDRFSTSTYQ